MGRNLLPRAELADHALEAWAKWAHATADGLGWPRRTLLAKVIEEGFTGAAQGGPPVTAPDLVLSTERAVLRLPKPEREALLAQYLYWEPVECRARRCHCSVPRYNRLLGQARRSVADYLEGALAAARQAATPAGREARQ